MGLLITSGFDSLEEISSCCEGNYVLEEIKSEVLASSGLD